MIDPLFSASYTSLLALLFIPGVFCCCLLLDLETLKLIIVSSCLDLSRNKNQVSEDVFFFLIFLYIPSAYSFPCIPRLRICNIHPLSLSLSISGPGSRHSKKVGFISAWASIDSADFLSFPQISAKSAALLSRFWVTPSQTAIFPFTQITLVIQCTTQASNWHSSCIGGTLCTSADCNLQQALVK